MAKHILYRVRAEEHGGRLGGNDPIWLWFENRSRNHDFIVSLLGEKGNVSVRISTPKGSKEYGLPFADTSFTRYKHDDFGDLRRFKERTADMIKRDFGYDVELR